MTYTPTDEQIEALAFPWTDADDDGWPRGVPLHEAREFVESPAFQAIIRDAQVGALRDAAFSGHYGTTAQSTLLRRAERIESGDAP